MTKIPTEGLRTQTVRYTNWRGETRVRQIVPLKVHFGSTNWHPKPQWLLNALDPEDGTVKDFALAGCDFVNLHVPDGQRILLIDDMDEETVDEMRCNLDRRLKQLVKERTDGKDEAV